MCGVRSERTRATGRSQPDDWASCRRVTDCTIAGCSVLSGKIARGANIRLLRDSVVVYEGKLSSLKRFKDDVKEVAEGYECGLGIDGYNDLQVGDQIEAFVIEKIAGTLA